MYCICFTPVVILLLCVYENSHTLSSVLDKIPQLYPTKLFHNELHFRSPPRQLILHSSRSSSSGPSSFVTKDSCTELHSFLSHVTLSFIFRLCTPHNTYSPSTPGGFDLRPSLVWYVRCLETLVPHRSDHYLRFTKSEPSLY